VLSVTLWTEKPTRIDASVVPGDDMEYGVDEGDLGGDGGTGVPLQRSCYLPWLKIVVMGVFVVNESNKPTKQVLWCLSHHLRI
jgi:hypothetical protein